MNITLSIVTPCCNDFENLVSTLTSMRDELNDRDELVIVDSSTDRERVRALVGSISLPCAHRYVWMPPKGIYGAQNRGILETTGEWIQIVNSGDRLCLGARREIEKALNAYPDVKVHVFRQRGVAPNVASHVFSPTANSVWPHQSIIVHKSVYQKEGLYSEEYRLCADQVYFAKVRRSYQWKLHPFVLTDYLLGGLSSGVAYKNLCEIYSLRRALGQGLVRSIIGSFILPVGRKVLEKAVGQKAVINLKCRLFSCYRHG
jgi:glycosyltransferase involved in cell wall biosynthesis